MNKLILKSATVLLALSSSLSYAQNKQDIELIKRSTNVSALKKMSKDFLKESQENKAKALKLAKEKGWEIKGFDKNGSYFELMSVSDKGSPIYYKTNNTSSAKSTRANTLNSGGLLGLDLNGEEMTAHVWDSGSPLITHVEYQNNITGNSRVRYMEENGAELSNHSAHVMGTLLATGVNSSAKGMAPKAEGKSYNWNNDRAEAVKAASEGMLLSNHSYGLGFKNILQENLGAYLDDARDWDNIMYAAPYYLMVVAAGNDGTKKNDTALEENNEFDKLSHFKIAKNNLVVANYENATIDEQGNFVSSTRWITSSQGPTDDYRIKPDISGNGFHVFSTLTDNNNKYGHKTGTSMATPNVMGSLLLLQQHYKAVNGNFMKAATLKGLALHTADDLEMLGPDSYSGWGLLNAKFAAETISKNGQKSSIKELLLESNNSHTFTVNAIPNQELKISISWTDIAGNLATVPNSNTPVLINDLDLKVTQSQQNYLPWKLTSVLTNGKGDNNVDPFERVDIPNANGQYTITVTHKGELKNQKQNFSIIVTGGKIEENNHDVTEPIDIQYPNPNFCVDTKVKGNAGFFGRHISWKITNSDNEVVMSKNRHRHRESINKVKCLDTGCYTFEVKDSSIFANGFDWLGWVKVIVNEEDKVSITGNFGSSATAEFCISSEFATNEDQIEEYATDEINISPNPVTDGFILLESKNMLNATYEVYDTLGRRFCTGKLTEGFAKVNTHVLNSGNYFVKLSNGKREITKKIIVK